MSELADVALIAWTFDFERDQKAFLLRAAGLGSYPALINRAWHELAASERVAICAAVSRALEVAEVVSGDLSR